MFRPKPLLDTYPKDEKIDEPIFDDIDSVDLNDYHFEFPCTIAMAGKKKCGKTTALKAFTEINQDNFDNIVIFSGSEGLGPQYDYMNKKNVLFLKNNISILMKLYETQGILTRKGITHRLLIVLDDFVGTLALNRGGQVGNLFLEILTQGRHRNISLMLLTQSLNNILAPAQRENIDYWFIFKVAETSLEKIKEELTDTSTQDLIRYYKKKQPIMYSTLLIQSAGLSNTPEVVYCRPVKINPKYKYIPQSKRNDSK